LCDGQEDLDSWYSQMVEALRWYQSLVGPVKAMKKVRQGGRADVMMMVMIMMIMMMVMMMTMMMMMMMMMMVMVMMMTKRRQGGGGQGSHVAPVGMAVASISPWAHDRKLYVTPLT
jgi:hypothetical protein